MVTESASCGRNTRHLPFRVSSEIRDSNGKVFTVSGNVAMWKISQLPQYQEMA